MAESGGVKEGSDWSMRAWMVLCLLPFVPLYNLPNRDGANTAVLAVILSLLAFAALNLVVLDRFGSLEAKVSARWVLFHAACGGFACGYMLMLLAARLEDAFVPVMLLGLALCFGHALLLRSLVMSYVAASNFWTMFALSIETDCVNWPALVHSRGGSPFIAIIALGNIFIIEWLLSVEFLRQARMSLWGLVVYIVRGLIILIMLFLCI